MEDIKQFLGTNEQHVSKVLPKTCIICFKTHNSKSKSHKDLFELWLADTEEITLLEKLQTFVQEKLWTNNCTVLCENCMKDLNEACHFRKRLLKSQEIWKTAFLDTVSSDLPNQAYKLKHLDLNKLSEAETSDEADNEENDNTTSICSYEIKADPENIKEVEVSKDLLSFYPCKNCEAIFADNTEFSQHKCGQNLSQDPSLILKSSEGESDLQTDLITKNTSKKKLKKRDRRIEGKIECDICGKSFRDSYGKNRHKVKVHFQNKVFACTFCKKSFKQKYHLKEHLTSHTGEKNYSCSICKKTFTRVSSQRRHIRSHERAPGEKSKQTPFLCSICGKSFPYSNAVQRHMRVHTGERKYECKVCERKFTQNTHLQVHLRTHTGEKPYMCNFCGKAFSLKKGLKKHVMNCHNADK